MFYAIRHITKFRYSAPVFESTMEVRMHPTTDDAQRCLTFQLSVSPPTRVFTYRDYLGNYIHHFNVPRRHERLVIVAEAIVDSQPQPEWPQSLEPAAWQELDRMIATGDYWEMLTPSQYVQPSGPLQVIKQELRWERRDDPLSLLRELNHKLSWMFEYRPQSTRVDSPITEALRARQGVCQDFSHIMIALVRDVGIPCRYVSGYLYHRKDMEDRSAVDATHAWVEALLPGLGWVGFDPTNNLLTGERHIRTAIGRDYADVPPAKGVFKGNAASELSVAVHVAPSQKLEPAEEELMSSQDEWTTFLARDHEAELLAQQQQQQQQ